MCRAYRVANSNHLSALSVRRGSPAIGSEQPVRKPPKRPRPSEKMAELQQQQKQKKARTAATTPEQFGRPPRPFVEDVEDEGDGLSDQPSRHDRRAVNNQPDIQTLFTSNAARAKTGTVPALLGSQTSQGAQNEQSGKTLVPVTALSILGSNNAVGQPGPRATPSAGLADAMVDLTGDDEEDEENNGVPPGKPLHPRVTFRFD